MIMIMMINAQSIDIIDQWVSGGYSVALTERNAIDDVDLRINIISIELHSMVTLNDLRIIQWMIIIDDHLCADN